MEARELRIGNWVKTGYGHKYQVAFIKDESDEDCLPIPLTEDWLLKFGFEKQIIKTLLKGVNIINYRLNNFIVYILPNSFEVELIREDGEQFNLWLNFDKTIHILQNLYFALKGEELTIKQTV
jgi:hypothetical protein